MNNEGLRQLDNFLLNCADISQDEREEIMEFANVIKDGYVEVIKHG